MASVLQTVLPFSLSAALRCHCIVRLFLFAIIGAFLFSCSSDHAPQLRPDSDNGGLILPSGFGALIVADSVGRSRHLAVNDNGDIYVKLRVVAGDRGTMALRDIDGDGRADIMRRFGDYPNDGSFATEMRIHNGYLYFSTELVVYRQKLTPGKLIPDDIPRVVLKDHLPMRWHNAKSLAFDNLGSMYVTFSAPTNACEDWESVAEGQTANVTGLDPCPDLNEMGGIWKFDADRLSQSQADGRRFATGIRSVVAMAWNTSTNQLYGINHGRDYLHSHAPQLYSEWQNSVLPAEEFMLIREGDNFGWPFSYYDHFQNKRLLAPEYGGNGQIQATKYTNPILGLPAHWAPNDMLFYTGDQFPERYKHGAFIAFHGSTNRTPYPQAGYVVGFVPFADGRPSGDLEIFADGFAGVDHIPRMDDAEHRPMGLAQGPDGSLYISESKKGRIWRVLFTGDRSKFTRESLQGMEFIQKQKSYLRQPDPIQDLLSDS